MVKNKSEITAQKFIKFSHLHVRKLPPSLRIWYGWKGHKISHLMMTSTHLWHDHARIYKLKCELHFQADEKMALLCFRGIASRHKLTTQIINLQIIFTHLMTFLLQKKKKQKIFLFKYKSNLNFELWKGSLGPKWLVIIGNI